MRLSISNIAWTEEEDAVVFHLMKSFGFTGLEIAPTRMISPNPYDRVTEAQELISAIRSAYGLKVSSMQSILFTREERIFGSDEERKYLAVYLKKAIDFAEAIECGNLVFGCPKNRIMEKVNDYNLAVEFFEELGDYAFQHNSALSIEPNPIIYGTNFINRTEEAVQLVQDVSSKGFRINLDFGTVIENREDIQEVEKIAGLINHVHISEPNLLPIKQRPEHQYLADMLKHSGYSKSVSIEMKRLEQNNLRNIEDALYYVSDIFGGK